MSAARTVFEERIRRLAGHGHRGSASPSEVAAANYLAEVLRGIGLQPTREQFRGSRSMGARLLVPVLLAALGLVLAWYYSALLALFFGAVALVALVHEQMTGSAWLTRFVTRSPSANIVATVPAGGAVRGRLVLCAHYDTQRAGLIWNRFTMICVAPVMARLPGPLKTPLFLVVLALVYQCLLPLLIRPLSIEPAWAFGPPLAVYGVALLLLGEWAVRGYVPGASDNASGVAAVLEVAGRWLAEPVDGVELVVLLSSCEETGLLGAAAWCDRHRGEIVRTPTRFLNVDSVGFGPPRFLGCDTPMAGWTLRYPRAMTELAKEAVATKWKDAGPHALPGPTDGLAFLARGIPGVTVVGFRGAGVMEYYHQPGDTVEHVDFDAAWDGAEFAWALCRRLAAD